MYSYCQYIQLLEVHNTPPTGDAPGMMGGDAPGLMGIEGWFGAGGGLVQVVRGLVAIAPQGWLVVNQSVGNIGFNGV
jgi:hypothetical protein